MGKFFPYLIPGEDATLAGNIFPGFISLGGRAVGDREARESGVSCFR